MINKTIIAVYGRQNEGKSETIKRVCQILLSNYPNAASSILTIDYSIDILVAIQIGNIKIGFESQGDPNSRMINEDTLRKLADKSIDPLLGGCDIIICATRTKKDTVKKVDQIATDYDFHTLWISSFWSPTLKPINMLNNFAAENIVTIIEALISNQLSSKF